MSDQTENLQAVCTDCKSNLSKEPHKEDCPISLKQKADYAEKIRLENEKAEQQKREQEQKEILEKELAVEKAKQELEEKNKKEIARQADELKKKHAVLDKIKKLIPNDNFKDQDVLDLPLDQIFELYKQVLKTVKDEKTNGNTGFDVVCPICNEVLGDSDTYKGAQKMQKEHKKEKHPSAGAGNWLVIALIFGMVTAGAVGAYKMYKKKKKQDESSK